MAIFKCKMCGGDLNITDKDKIDNSFNFSVFKKLHSSLNYRLYDLRVAQTGLITNIGSLYRQYSYKETDFFDFDSFLFTTWNNDQNPHKKESVSWGEFMKFD